MDGRIVNPQFMTVLFNLPCYLTNIIHRYYHNGCYAHIVESTIVTQAIMQFFSFSDSNLNGIFNFLYLHQLVSLVVLFEGGLPKYQLIRANSF